MGFHAPGVWNAGLRWPCLGPPPTISVLEVPDVTGELALRQDPIRPFDGDAWTHDSDPRRVDLSPDPDASRTHRVQLSGVQQGCMAQISEGVAEPQNLGKKIQGLKRIHANFYPKPADLQASSPGKGPIGQSERFLSEEKLVRLYGKLGNILHAENPLGKETDYRFFIDAAPGWLSEVENLLECHKVYLLHRPEEFYLVKRKANGAREYCRALLRAQKDVAANSGYTISV